jgi:putative membrane protein
MTLFRQAFKLAFIEARYLCSHPRLVAAALVVILVPALYAWIYLASVWDPTARTNALAVGVINLDQGIAYHELQFNIGREVVAELKTGQRFNYIEYIDEAQIRRDVRNGALSFALIIPKDLSAQAVPGTEAGAGKPVIYAAEGNNYEAGAIAQRFAETLGERINTSLNERRWALVLSSEVGSERGVAQLRRAVDALDKGAHELRNGARRAERGADQLALGAGRVAEGEQQLSAGMRQLSNGLRSIDAQRPHRAELGRLDSGAAALSAGHAELAEGLGELQRGSARLREGVQKSREKMSDSLFVPDAVSSQVEQLADGLQKLDNGIGAARGAQQKLAEGFGSFNTGVASLANGTRSVFNAVHGAVGKLPEERELDALDKGTSELAQGVKTLSDGNRRVASGADQLAFGIDQLARALPASLSKPDGSPRGLANSIEPRVERYAPVENSGSGFAPNMLPAALWLGCGVVIFLLHVRILPREAAQFSHPARLLGKMLLPAALVLLQTLCLLLTALFVLHIHVVDIQAFVMVLSVSALTFLCIVFALAKGFGDAGKGGAMILLALQLSSSGGVMPVELSGRLFMSISPWLPLTWSVKAIKVSMFGAFEGAWQQPLLVVAVFGLGALLLSACVGRWRFVSHDTMRPSVEL